MGAPKTMRSPRSGRLREVDPLHAGLGRTVTRTARSSRPSTPDHRAASAPASRRKREQHKLSPSQIAAKAREEAAIAEAAAVATAPPPPKPTVSWW
jgi:hypothetical protein